MKQPGCEVDRLLLKLSISGAIPHSFMECRGTTVVLRFTVVDNYILLENIIFDVCYRISVIFIYTKSVL